MIDKWTRKYMKLAKTLADDNESCYSRKIGVILVTAGNSATCGGWNGSIRKGEANDSFNRLFHIFKEVMTPEQKATALAKYGVATATDFAAKHAGCQTCPRKLLDIPSGQGLDLCNCAHAERNALANANRAGLVTLGSEMFCACGVPCHDCAIQIIQAGVKRVVCLKTSHPDYSPSSRYLFQEAGVGLVQVHPDEVFS
jgi:deoxycytidylate deaminase